MKKLLLCLFIASVSSSGCINKRAKLVDLQKKYADSVVFYNAVWKQNALSEERMKMTSQEAVKLNMEDKIREIKCQQIVDSIEWELKKY